MLVRRLWLGCVGPVQLFLQAQFNLPDRMYPQASLLTLVIGPSVVFLFTLISALYPALRRLEKSGLLRSRWEKQKDAYAEGRPRRRIYELTASGARALPLAEQKLAEMRQLLGRIPPAPQAEVG